MSLSQNNLPLPEALSPVVNGNLLPPISPNPPPELSNNLKNRMLLELDTEDDDNDDVPSYDLYHSPCRGVLLASNDELLDHTDLSAMNDDAERNDIISYNNNGKQNKASGLYSSYQYYFDDIEYCGSTFFGGCRFRDLEELEDTTLQANNSPALTPQTYVNWTVMYDYEMHYVNSRGRKQTGNASQAENSMRNDPIPALQHLETIVVEHLSEIVGLNRRGCDFDDASSIKKRQRYQQKYGRSNNNIIRQKYQQDFAGGSSIGRYDDGDNINKSRNYKHDFSKEELERMLAISSEPKDVLDPNHAICMLPVDASIDDTTDCVPVTGGIRIYVNTTGINNDWNGKDARSLSALKSAIQNGFEQLIRFGMQQDLYVSEEDNSNGVLVKHVSFIGTRVVNGNMEGAGTQIKENDGLTNATSTGAYGTEDDEASLSSPDDTDSPSLNLINDGTTINGSDTNRSNIVGIAFGSIAIIIVAALIAFKSKNAKKIQSSHVPLAADETAAPIDIERQLNSNDSLAAMCSTDDDIYEDGVGN